MPAIIRFGYSGQSTEGISRSYDEFYTQAAVETEGLEFIAVKVCILDNDTTLHLLRNICVTPCTLVMRRSQCFF